MVGLIVEGASDKYLLEAYYKNTHQLYIVETKLQNINDLKNVIYAMSMRYPSLSKIVILVDLDTKHTGVGQFECVIELRNWYKQNKLLGIKDKNVKEVIKNIVEILIVEKELESWMMTHWNIQSNTKTKEDLKLKMKAHFNESRNIGEIEMAKKFIFHNMQMRITHNNSLKKFENKISIAKKQ